jgi:DNA-binding transcriptional ArsR family regulator
MHDSDFELCEECNYHPQRICLASQQLLTDNIVFQLAETFKVVGDPTRIKILHALSKGEMCVCDIAETLNMGQSAISHQLRVLRNARLVKFRKDGKTVWYSLDDDHVVALLCQGLEHISHS